LIVEIMIMSGVEDGRVLRLDSEASEGRFRDDEWTLTIGRREDCDVCLRNDSFISREHARLHLRDNRWWLEDGKSKNGTLIEQGDEDMRVEGTIPVEIGQIFRIGRTWLRIQAETIE
jgi:pSer/pThr/pTyr-binding forkhead associated (FHA) protein